MADGDTPLISGPQVLMALAAKTGKVKLECELCQRSDWRGGQLTLIRALAPGETFREIVEGRGNKIVPVALVHCGHCGNTKALNLFALGLIKRPEDTVPGQEPEMSEELKRFLEETLEGGNDGEPNEG